ncbi:UNVERIFIED_CONTAM: putative ATP-grasp superfamily ATP-dependent carboligase [Brevibacillus sp. OAP136]
MKRTHCTLVLGGSVAGYSIIRELHEKGLREIVLFDTEKRLAAYSNRLCKFVHVDDSTEALFAAIESLHQEYEHIIIFPTGDKQIEQLDDLYERIESYCFLPFNHDNLRIFVNKMNQYHHCEMVGIPYPKTIILHDPAETESILQIPFPLLLKPSKQDSRAFKNLVLHSADDFLERGGTDSAIFARGDLFSRLRNDSR